MSDTRRTPRARAVFSSISSLLVATLLAMLSVSAAVAQSSEEPELTWAPLETPPPLSVPRIWTPTEQADGFALGSPDAPVTIEVWEDFQCPFCRRFADEVHPGLVEGYVENGDVRLVFRNLAFLGNESHWAAVAGSLAADQNQFWPFHDYLFANFRSNESGAYHIDRLVEMGEAVGLDMDEFRTGLSLDNARERFAQIQAESRRDATAMGINATPTVVVNGVPLDAPDLESVSAAVDIELAKWRTANETEADTEGEGEE